MSELTITKIQFLLQQNKYAEADKLITILLSEEPDNAFYLTVASDIARHLGQLERAMNLVNAAILVSPDEDFVHYTKAQVHIELNELFLAQECLKAAVRIEPNDPDNYALWAHVTLNQKKYEAALEQANKALQLDPENILALNTRSTALMKLNRSYEASKTMEGALKEDPNNAYTHTNYGWNLLEKGKHKKALSHFREALKSNPDFEYAQAGMVEALKSRYLLYRWFLKYFFWMNNLTAKNQWVVIIVLYVGMQIINRLSTTMPFLKPVAILLMAFAFSTWILPPLSNLLLRINPYGKYMLDHKEIMSSNFVGISLLIAFVSIILYAITGLPFLLSLCILGVAMMIPLGTLFARTKHKFTLPGYTILLGVFGLLSVIATANTGELFTAYSTVFLLGFVAYQWVANYLIIDA